MTADRRKSYLHRQLGTLALAHVSPRTPGAVPRAAAWHNVLAAAGAYLPLVVVHDVGHLVTGGRSTPLAVSADVVARAGLPPESRPLFARYRELCAGIAAAEVAEQAAGWRLRDDLVGAVLLRILGDVWQRWPFRGKATGGATLPADPGMYAGVDPIACFKDFDPRPLVDFFEHLTRSAWHVTTAVELIDLDTLRLIGLFPHSWPAGEAALALPDLLFALRSPEAHDVVDFSLDLLPSVLETQRRSSAQTFATDGYASLERRGSVDSLVLTELAHDDDLFERKIVDDELYYYGRERERDEERRLHLILIDSSASMRGQRQVFARGLALALAKKRALAGDEVWLRFFDSRLHETIKLARTGSFSVPYLLAFRSERGRNYARVFRQLLLDLGRLHREQRRRVIVSVITHGQCHIPVELVTQLKPLCTLHGVFILPSSEIALDYLPLFDHHHVVAATALDSRRERKDKALDILEHDRGH